MPFSGGWDVRLFERAECLAPVGRKGRRLVFRDSPCICNGVSPEMLVWATVEACSRATALSLRQFCLPREKGPGFDTAGSHSEEIENCAFRLVQVHQGWPRPESVEPRFGHLVRLFPEKFCEVDQ